MLVLESMQSGLSWLTILRKRENFRRAFSDFDISAVAKYSAAKIDKLEILWPSGMKEDIVNPPADTVITVVEGKGQSSSMPNH